MSAEILEDSACIAILQGEAKLNTQKAETHVPYLQEAQPGFCGKIHGFEGKVGLEGLEDFGGLAERVITTKLRGGRK